MSFDIGRGMSKPSIDHTNIIPFMLHAAMDQYKSVDSVWIQMKRETTTTTTKNEIKTNTNSNMALNSTNAQVLSVIIKKGTKNKQHAVLFSIKQFLSVKCFSFKRINVGASS